MDCYKQHIENRMPRRRIQWPVVLILILCAFLGYRLIHELWKLIERVL
jgi:lauroyl/myristoyl acyltransferase